MNCEFSLNLSDLETLFAKSNCSCHFINPNKTRIILWKEVKDNAVTYYLRIGIQKFISYPLADKNNETYWRFNDYAKSPQLLEKTAATKPELDPITKFNHRQAQAYGKPNNAEPAVTNFQSS